MSVFEQVGAIASARHGVVTRRELRDCGCSDRQIRTLVAQGLLIRRARGIYVMVGSPDSWEQRLSVACLTGGPLAMASFRGASGLWRLDRFRQGHVEISAPEATACVREGVRVHRSVDLPTRDIATVDGIPVTSPTRTLIDMGRYVGERRLGAMVDDAVRRGLTSYEELHLRFAELARSGRNGITTMRAVLADRPGGAPVPGSPFELRVRDLLVDAGLPVPVLQHRVSRGEITYVLDLAWPDRLVAVECDGFRFHRTPDQLEWDDRRRNELSLRGWLVHHVTWRQLTREPDALVHGVRRALAARS